MSRRRDELRRGIRSLIQDTSREMADLEGRPLPAEGPREGTAPAPPEAPAPEGPALGSAAPSALEHPAAPPAAPSPPGVAWIVGPDSPGPPRGHEHAGRPAPSGPPEQPDQRPAGPPAVAQAAEPSAPTIVRVPRYPATRPAEPPSRRSEAPAGADPPRGDPRPARPPVPAGRPGIPRAARPERTVKVTPGRRKAARRGRTSRAVAEFIVDGVNPQQASSRKGVCLAYFVDHQCWRVPDAYCNTALQVCAIRNCPVYHLHKEALERRFAGKFKHFW